MVALTNEEAAKEEAEILAEEQAIKKRWCRLKGHRWDLPQPNPLNADLMSCRLMCNRCGVHATLTIAIDAPKADTSNASAPVDVNLKPAPKKELK
jgi:hypothetical protein